MLSKKINKKLTNIKLVLIIIAMCIVFLFLYYVFWSSIKKREGFVWNQKSIYDFTELQSKINPHKIFDTNMLQKQASQEEVNYYNKNGSWQWSLKTQYLYKNAVEHNPYIKTLAADALIDAMKIYNESAILQILSQQTKEGQFLLNGILISPANSFSNTKEQLPNGYGSFAYTSGLIEDNTKEMIKCNTNGHLERTTYTGKGGIFGEQTKQISILDYNHLENIIPGFTFIDKPCNPCAPFNDTSDYSCPFKIKVKKNDFISEVWRYLWNI